MKKLMIAAAIVCAAAMSQAAAITWGFSWATDADANNLPTTATAYLINVADYAIDTATTDLLNGEFNTLKVTDTQSILDGGDDYGAWVNASGIASDLENSQTWYSVVVNGDQFMVIDDTVSVTMKPSGPTVINFGELSDENTGASNYVWQTSAVPEPTTGLLMLLGMAGLALRRRRA